jgi:hypothetical protein
LLAFRDNPRVSAAAQLPLITVWLQVRVLPGAPRLESAVDFAGLRDERVDYSRAFAHEAVVGGFV